MVKSSAPPPSPLVDDDPESVRHRVVCNLALLIRWSQAEQRGDRDGTNIELDQAAWSAAEMLLLEARDVLNRVDTERGGR